MCLHFVEDVMEDGGRRTEDAMEDVSEDVSEDGGRRTEDVVLIPNFLHAHRCVV